MKKLAILLGAVVMSGTLLAQKPSSDDSNYSLEGMINYSDAGFEWNAPNLRMRYFINDNIAARVTIGLSMDNTSGNYYEGDPGTGVGTIDESSTTWSIGLGGEYHLSGTDKLSPYFSAGVMFGGMSNSIVGTDVDEIFDPLDDALYESGSSHESSGSASMFGLGLGAGMDYYVFDNVYLGVELGFSWMSMTDKGGSISSTTAAGTTDITVDSAGSMSDVSLGGGNMGFRIGWRF
ncbi:outer membrane beta-barrel protein [Crocinitomicaceae bacterium]|nr:outer membrane beta-barrel protein [Crocinitomicaceae bacterium]